jgi:UDP-N-acetylmuramate: L-alanyl-gamma-D-glutamyl-meso-diaminopimelate ligase
VVREGVTYLITKKDDEVPLKIFGEHNLRNVSAAREVCRQLGIKGRDFYDAIRTFTGAARRLELVTETGTARVYRDFAHAPSKVRATTRAAREQFPRRRLVAVLELHTFSSLNPEFLPQYAGALDAADEAVVYFNPHVLQHKRLPELDPTQVQAAFTRPDIRVLTSRAELEAFLGSKAPLRDTTLLLMSSGTFDGMDILRVLEYGSTGVREH